MFFFVIKIAIDVDRALELDRLLATLAFNFTNVLELFVEEDHLENPVMFKIIFYFI